MLRIPVAAACCLLGVLLSACGVSETTGYRIQLTVLPSDTVVTQIGKPVTFDCLASQDGVGLAAQTIVVSVDGSSYAVAGQTDSRGHLIYVASDVPEGDSLIAYRFVVQRSSYNSSDVVTRYVAIRQPSTISVSIYARGVTEGAVTDGVSVPMIRTHRSRAIELLPRAFLASGSSVLDGSYGVTGIAPVFSYATNELDVNHHSADLLGQRMQQLPQATLSVVGTNCNSGIEKGNVTLSRARASSVRQQLMKLWNIDSARIGVDARNLPEIPTEPTTSEGIGENRRVDFSASSAELLAPVMVDSASDSVGVTWIAFVNSVTASAGVRSWTITADIEGRAITVPIYGEGAVPDTVFARVNVGPADVGHPIHYALTVTDSTDNVGTGDGYTVASTQMIVKQVFDPSSVSFDYNSAELNERGQQILAVLAERASSAEVKSITVEGFIASPETDASLAESRAQAVLSQSLPGVQIRIQSADQENLVKFPISLPEGRELDRRVEVQFAP